MTKTRLQDSVPLRGVAIDGDGCLVTEAYAAREGVQLYRASEIGLVGDDIRRVYRSGAELRKGVRGYSHAPVTIGHPPEPVTPKNWKDYAVGETSTEAEWVDGKIKLPLIVKDQAAIDAIKSGIRELSAGYTAVIDHTPGVTSGGQEYDAVQRDIKINHLAIVPRARGGPELRIGDGAREWGASPIAETVKTGDKLMTDKLTSVVLGDNAVSVAADSAPIIEQFKRDADAAQAKMIADHKAEIDAKDGEIGELKAKLADAEKSTPTAQQLDAMANARADLVARAKALHPDVITDGKSDEDIKREAVRAVHGDEMIKDMSDAAIDGVFRVACKKADPISDALMKDGESRHGAEWEGFFGKGGK